MYLRGKLKPGKGTDLPTVTCVVLCGNRALGSRLQAE